MYWIAAFVAFCWLQSFKQHKNPGGDILLAILWPVLIGMLVFYSIKKFVFRLHGPSDNPNFYFLEFLTILSMSCAGSLLVAHLRGQF